MSIDARVVGFRKISTEPNIKLTLEDRPGAGPAGAETLEILNTAKINKSHNCMASLTKLIGKEIWGNSAQIILGDLVLASREGYTGINLVRNWQNVITLADRK